MAHTSEYRWPLVVESASEISKKIVDILLEAESKYQDLLELYAYVGSTAQALADQLFFDDWSIRSNPGVQAILTYDATGGVITGVTVVNGGTGYTDGVGYLVPVQGGDGSGLIAYDVVAGVVTNATVDSAGTTYSGGSGLALNGFAEPESIPETQASAEEVAKAQDLVDAMGAIHEIYQAADNVAVGQEDRFVQVRRFT